MPESNITKSGALVVLVNDEVVQRTKIELWLKEEGFEVQPFDSAAAALEGMDKASPPDIIITEDLGADLFPPLPGALALFKELWIDVVVLDYHLPDMTGEDLLILGKEHLPEAAYIMMTADSDPKLALTWMKLGASWYIKKPFDPKYLIELCVKARREQALLRVEALLEERTRRLQESEDKYKTLFRELQHRVKNSLSLIVSLCRITSPCTVPRVWAWNW